MRLAQLTANRLQPMQMKRRARLKEAGGRSFRKERPWSWQQVSGLSLPELMSDNQQAGHCGEMPSGMESVHGNGEGPCLSGRTVERARSMPQEQALVCPVSTSTSFTDNRRMAIGSRFQSTCGQHRPSKRSGPCLRQLTLSRFGCRPRDLCGCRGCSRRRR